MICTQIAPLNFTITDEEVIDLTSPCFDGIFDNTPLGDGTDEIIINANFEILIDESTTALTTTVNLNCKSLKTESGEYNFVIGNISDIEYSGVFLFNITCDEFTNEGTIEFNGDATINCDEFTNEGYIYICADTTINCGKLNFKNEIKKKILN